ncbi:hypothetical protein E4U13_000916 [Claviceps humidiphila]|uniref:Uncharacterized protein n=1 Tax=Claviceps humidiphila TaxID=1294629 RepID=A0A9P7TRM1_9HYPO|nr:hypothetical protein E4U13_000916 [Claviceps humidiphila]
MALLNPVYAFVIPFLFFVTAPLALLAGITTTLTFGLLMSRVIIMSLDVAFSFIPQSLARFTSHRRYIHPQDQMLPATSTNTTPGSHEDSTRASSVYQQQPLLQSRRRRRTSSINSILSTGGTTTPVGPVGDFGLGLIPSIGPDRDYEGIGGWRVGDDDDESWTTINSRMELPEGGFVVHHYRTPSGGGATTPGDGAVLMMKTRRRSPEARAVTRTPSSPNSSRARTPSASRFRGRPVIGCADSYFPFNPPSKGSKRPYT